MSLCKKKYGGIYNHRVLGRGAEDMYNPELFFTDAQLEKVVVSLSIMELAEIFKRPIQFDRFSTRLNNTLKKYGCETVGDIYFLLILEGSSLGRVTVLDLFHMVVSILMPCKLTCCAS